MKIFILTVILFFAASNYTKISDDCKCKGIPLYGRVKVVDYNADFKVQVVKYLPDLKVQKVERLPDKCGKWQFVERHPDFTVQFIDQNHVADFKIQYVESHPGSPYPAAPILPQK
jgi:hypothetical protein